MARNNSSFLRELVRCHGKSALEEYCFDEKTGAIFPMTSGPSESKMYETSTVIEIHAAGHSAKSRVYKVHCIQENNILFTMCLELHLYFKKL